MAPTSEATLLIETPQTETHDLEEVFAALRTPLLRALHSMLGSREDAEDALQSAFVRCWQARAALPQIQNVRGWVWRVALNVGRDLLDYTRRRRYRSLAEVEATAVCPTPEAIDVVIGAEQKHRLRAALERLRPEEKEVFLLRQEQFPTYGTIARLRGVPIGSVKTLMHGAVQKLRGLLCAS